MKRMGRSILSLLLVLSFYGCATVPNLNGISLGMTKQDVLKIMGNPKSISAKGNIEYLKYVCSEGFVSSACNELSNREYFVRLVDGKVESYGNIGDFDSAKDQVNVIKLETQK